MPDMTLTPEELKFILEDEETCWKLHSFHREQANLSEDCYADKDKEWRIIAHHNERAQLWEDHVNDTIEN